MIELKNISDVLEVAVRIEREGINFYQKLHDLVDLSEAKDVFSYLAAEEEKHLGVFRELLEGAADYSPKIRWTGLSRPIFTFFKMHSNNNNMRGGRGQWH